MEGGGGEGRDGVRFISCPLWFLMTVLSRVAVGSGNLATLKRKGQKVSTRSPRKWHTPSSTVVCACDGVGLQFHCSAAIATDILICCVI